MGSHWKVFNREGMGSDKGFNMIARTALLGRVWAREQAHRDGKLVGKLSRWSRERNDGDLDSSNQSGKQCLNSGDIVKTERQESLEHVTWGAWQELRSKGWVQGCGFKQLTGQSSINYDDEVARRTCLWVKIRRSALDTFNFSCRVRIPSGYIKPAAESSRLQSQLQIESWESSHVNAI